MNVFELSALLKLDSSEYDKGLDDAGKKGSSFGQAMKTAGGVAAAGMVAVGAAAVNVTKGIATAAAETAAYGDTIDKNSQKLGLSAAAYQEWDYVLNLAGTSMGDMSTGMKTLTNQIDDAKNGSEDAAKRFAALGISMDDLGNMSREDAFKAVVAGMQQMEDSTERAALANDLFGKSGQNLTPLFNMTAEATQEAIDRANEYGMVMSDDSVKAAADYQDALTTMQNTITGVKNSFSSEFMPSITSVMNGLAAFISGDENGLEGINKGVLEFVNNMSEHLPQVLEMGSSILMSLVQGISDNLPSLLNSAVDVIMKLADGIIQNLPQILESAAQVVIALAEGIGDSLPTLIPTIVDTIYFIVDKLTQPDMMTQLIGAALKIMIGLANGLIRAIPSLLAAVPKVIANLISTFTSKDFLKQMGDVGANLLYGLAEGLGNAVAGVIQKAKEIAGQIVGAVKNAFGVHSPSRVFADIGDFLMQGLGNGIEDNAAYAIRSAQDMVDDLMATTDGLSMDADVNLNGRANGSAANGGDIIIPVYIGDSMVDEIVVDAKRRVTMRSGGYAYV